MGLGVDAVYKKREKAQREKDEGEGGGRESSQAVGNGRKRLSCGDGFCRACESSLSAKGAVLCSPSMAVLKVPGLTAFGAYSVASG